MTLSTIIQMIKRDISTFRATHSRFSFSKRDLLVRSRYEITITFLIIRYAGHEWPDAARSMNGGRAASSFCRLVFQTMLLHYNGFNVHAGHA